MSSFTIEFNQEILKFDEQYDFKLQGKMNEIEFQEFINGANDSLKNLRKDREKMCMRQKIHWCIAILNIILIVIGVIVICLFLPILYLYIILIVGFSIHIINMGFCIEGCHRKQSWLEGKENLIEFVSSYCASHNVRQNRGMNIVVKEKTEHISSSPPIQGGHGHSNGFFVGTFQILYLEFQFSALNINVTEPTAPTVQISQLTTYNEMEASF